MKSTAFTLTLTLTFGITDLDSSASSTVCLNVCECFQLLSTLSFETESRTESGASPILLDYLGSAQDPPVFPVLGMTTGVFHVSWVCSVGSRDQAQVLTLTQ